MSNSILMGWRNRTSFFNSSEIEAPSTETWIDSDPTTLRTVFKINEARKQNTELAKEEARCVIKRVNEILDVADRTDVDFADLVHFLVGANSELGKVLKKGSLVWMIKSIWSS